MPRYCTGPAYYRMCSTVTVQNKPAIAPKETITHHFLLHFWNWAEENIGIEICGGAESIVKTETQRNILQWIARFYTLSIYLRWKRVCIAHNNCMSCPSV